MNNNFNSLGEACGEDFNRVMGTRRFSPESPGPRTHKPDHYRASTALYTGIFYNARTRTLLRQAPPMPFALRNTTLPTAIMAVAYERMRQSRSARPAFSSDQAAGSPRGGGCSSAKVVSPVLVRKKGGFWKAVSRPFSFFFTSQRTRT